MNEELRVVIKNRLKELKESNLQSDACLDMIINIVSDEIDKADFAAFEDFIKRAGDLSCDCGGDCDCEE